MIHDELLKLLVCPVDHTPLTVASNELTARLNRAIALGQVKNRGGETVETRLSGGLVRADEAVIYPIVDEIPVILIDSGIPLDQPALISPDP